MTMTVQATIAPASLRRMLPSVWLDHALRRELGHVAASTGVREFVGLLAGERTASQWRVTAMLPLPNLATGNDAFVVDPVAFAAAEAALRTAGFAWLGFVHSHPTSSAAMSAVDRECLWRGCLQLIVGGVAEDDDDLRAYFGDAEGWHVLRLQPADAAAVS